MNSIEYEINNHCFIHNDEEYDCSFAIEHDIKLIIQEAETSHKDTFDELYNRDSLTPKRVRLFLDDNAFALIFLPLISIPPNLRAK